MNQHTRYSRPARRDGRRSSGHGGRRDVEQHPARFLVAVLLIALSGCVPPAPSASSQAGPADRQELSQPGEVSEARAEFDEFYAQWTAMLGQLRDLELAFHTAPAGQRDELAQQYFDKLSQGYTMEQEFLSSAIRAFATAPDQNEDLKEVLIQISTLLVGAECYEDGLHVAQMLLDNEVEEERVYQNAAEAAFACSEFRLSERYMKVLRDRMGISEINTVRLSLIDEYEKEWAREQQLREEEQLAGICRASCC